MRSAPRAALATAIVCFLAAGSASAKVTENISLTWPDSIAGQSNVTATITVANANSGPNQSHSNTVTSIKLAPSCGAAGTFATPCSVPDLGVFALSGPWSGAALTACASASFAPSAPGVNGVVILTPSLAVALTPPGTINDHCTLNLTFNTLHLPVIDAAPQTAGMQTSSNLAVQSRDITTALLATDAKQTLSTVNRATPALVTAAATATLGQPVRDTATVTTSVPARATGTVTFDLYRPADPTCAAAPIFTSTNALGAGGVVTSGAFTPTVAGKYRWRAGYSGDVNHVPLALATCNAPGETSGVTRPQTALGVLFDTSVKRLRVSKRGRFTYSFLATPLRSGKISLESTTKVKIGSTKRFMKIAAKSFTAPATSQVSVTFKLSRKNLKTLKRKKKLRFVVTATLDGKTSTTKLTLKRPKKS